MNNAFIHTSFGIWNAIKHVGWAWQTSGRKRWLSCAETKRVAE